MTVPVLLLLTFGICAVLGAIVILVVRLFPKSVDASTKGQMESATPILTLLFGASITLAAAIATVSLGNTTMKLTEQQSSRDLQIRMQREVDAINERFTNLTIAVSNILSGGFGIMGSTYIEMERNPDFLDEAYQVLPDGLRSEVAVFIDALDAFVAALHSVQSHPYANRLLSRQFDQSTGALEYLSDLSRDLGITHYDDIQTLDVVTFRITFVGLVTA